MILGYARVSTLDQCLDRQLDQLKEHGCERIYLEKITGRKRKREELNRMLDQIRKGDVVVITELSRLSRSTKDLFQIVEIIRKKEAEFVSLKEPWTNTTAAGNFMFTIVAGVNQFESDIARQRTQEGLAAARARGRKGGRPPKDEIKKKTALTMYDSKNFSLAAIVKETGISKSGIYRYLQQRETLQAKDQEVDI